MAYRKQTKLKDAIIGELDELKCIINKKIADLESSVEFAHSSVEELKSTVDAKLKSHEVKLEDKYTSYKQRSTTWKGKVEVTVLE